MPFPTLVLPPLVNASPGSSVSYKPRVLMAQFGDGYTQRTSDGLNTNPSRVEVMFTPLTRIEGNTIIAFFAERAGYKPFLWLMPGESVTRQWIATEWRLSITERMSCDVTAMLEENYDP